MTVTGGLPLGAVTRGLGDGVTSFGVTSTALYECEECGAVVANPDRHFRWHEALDVATQWAEPKARADYEGQQRSENDQGMAHGRATKNVETLGWSDCGHDNWRRGLVLDPFGGSGTVSEIASGHGRDSILIDIDERNAELAHVRVGMFLTVDAPEAVA